MTIKVTTIYEINDEDVAKELMEIERLEEYRRYQKRHCDAFKNIDDLDFLIRLSDDVWDLPTNCRKPHRNRIKDSYEEFCLHCKDC